MHGISLLDLVDSQGVGVLEDAARVDEALAGWGDGGVVFAGELFFEGKDGGGEGEGEDVFGVGGGFDVEGDGNLVWVGGFVGHGCWWGGGFVVSTTRQRFREGTSAVSNGWCGKWEVEAG